VTRTMPKSGQTEKQMVGMLRQVEAGARVDDVCRKVGISQAIHIAKQVWRPRRLYLVPLEVVGFTKQQSDRFRIREPCAHATLASGLWVHDSRVKMKREPLNSFRRLLF